MAMTRGHHEEQQDERFLPLFIATQSRSLLGPSDLLAADGLNEQTDETFADSAGEAISRKYGRADEGSMIM
jgi:hypothetical protein